MRAIPVFVLVGLLGLVGCRQQYRGNIPNGIGVPCPPGDPSCEENELCEGLGHESCAGGVVSPRLNPFGQDLLSEGIEWTKDLCEKDSDGDGFSNGYELGDPCCIWKEGVILPKWMEEWEVSHPGFKDSTQLGDKNIEELCKDAKPLEEDGYYNEGEDQLNWEFNIKEYTIPNEDTSYIDFRFNFPEEGEFYLVGADALVDNVEMVHHFIVNSCNTKVDEDMEGIPHESTSTRSSLDCSNLVWGWAPGGRYQVPKIASFPLSGAKGINLQVHYDNPLLQKGRTDASGLRFHLTTTPRKEEAGIIRTGGVVSVGVIPPKKKVYSATIYQMKVDPKLAPDGILLYGFGPHMHELGKKMWVERLRKKPENEGELLQDLKDLEKVDEIARDDTWSIDLQGTQDVPLLHVRDGDYLATTCIFDSESRDEPTLGGLSSRDEMCIAFLSYYPSEAIDHDTVYSGPLFSNVLEGETYDSVTSFMDILNLPESNTAVSGWRRAYLSGELVCKEESVDEVNLLKRSSLFLGRQGVVRMLLVCGKQIGFAFLYQVDVLEKPSCSKECAKHLYNILGCGLVKNAVSNKSGKILELYPSVLEAHVDDWCGQEFPGILKENRVSEPRRIGDL